MYGGITGLALMILGLVLHVAGLSFDAWAPYVSYLVFLIGIILNANAYSKANNNYVTFGNVFSSGFKASAIVTLISVAWGIIFVMLFPEIKEKGMEKAMEDMAKRGMSEEQIEQGIEMTRKFFTVAMIGGLVFMYMFFGAIFSLIGAAIAKKKGPEPMVPQV